MCSPRGKVLCRVDLSSTGPPSMDSTRCTPVTCVSTCCDAFYFQVGTAETDVDGDGFDMSPICLSRWVCSSDNKYLLLNTEGQFQVQNITEAPQEKFQIQAYRDLDPSGGRQGKVVMLYMKNGGENVVVCCDHKHAVYPKRMETLPSDIPSSKDAALFYMSALSARDAFHFESSLYPSEFLGFEPSDNPSLHQLVLHKRNAAAEDVTMILMETG